MNSYKIEKWAKKFTISERKKFAITAIKTCESCKFSNGVSMCINCPFAEIFDAILKVNQKEKKNFKPNN